MQNKYKNIHKDFGLIILCISNDISNDIIDYLLSKYEKNDRYVDIYTCHLMLLVSSEKYDILELFLKNGFDVNRTLYFDGEEHNLLFYISERVHKITESTIDTILNYGINIDSKLKFNIDYLYTANTIYGFIEKTFSCKENTIFDLLIEKIINDFEYHFMILHYIFNYYCNIKENILSLRKCIDNLSDNTIKILASENSSIQVIKIFITYCYFNKDELTKSKFYENFLNHEPSFDIINKINLIYEVNQDFLKNKEKSYHFNHFHELIKEKKYNKIEDDLDDMFDIDYQEPDTLKTPLMIASQYGINNIKLFDYLAMYEPDKDLQDKTKSTALHIACKYNNSEIIPKLITEKNINMKDINGKTPLMIAIEEKNSECIKTLFSNDCSKFHIDINIKDDCDKYNVDANIKDNDGNSSLINTIIKFKNSKELEELIELLIVKGANKDEINNDKATPLHVICQYNLYKLIPKLITQNNVNLKDKNGQTPLMVAIENKNNECIKTLLSANCDKYNVDVNVKDNNCNISLSNALIKFKNSKKLEELIDLLIEKGANKDEINNDKATPLHISCQYNLYKLILKLISNNNVNMKDKNRQTPLMVAIENKNNECIKTLLSANCDKYNVDANIKDNNGNSSLVNTIIKFKNSKELEELIELLIIKGANKDEVNNDKVTSLHFICQYNLYKLIPKLITQNNVNLKDKNGQTPLMVAIENKNNQCIKTLLSDEFYKYNVDANIKDNNGNSPLVNIMLKFKDSDKIDDLIDLLIKRGANKDEYINGKATPLHVACQYNLYDSIPKLITENNINIKNKKNQTPLMIACNGQKIQCIEKLMTNKLFIKNYKVNNNNNELNILLLLLKHKVENEQIYEELIKWNLYFGLKQFKKNLNIIVNNESFIRVIIKNGFYIHKDNKHENIKTPLIFSIVNNFKELTKSILNCYDKTIHETDENNKYCLFYAIDNEDEEYFDLLMKSKKI